MIVPTEIRPLIHQHTETFRRVARRLKPTRDPFWGGVENTEDAVSCTTWQRGGGGGKDGDDRHNEFPKALIRIDTADRILMTAGADEARCAMIAASSARETTTHVG